MAAKKPMPKTDPAYEKGSGNHLPKDMMGTMAKCLNSGKSMKACRKQMGP